MEFYITIPQRFPPRIKVENGELNVAYCGLSSLSQIKFEKEEDIEEVFKLNLSHNHLTKRESFCGLNQFVNLKELIVVDNWRKEGGKHLKIDDMSILQGLGSLNSLQYISLSDNNIREISGLEGLANLKHLWLSSNHIREIQDIQHLSNLR